VGPPDRVVDPGPTAQPLLRPSLKSESFRSKPPSPASGASARQCDLSSGSSLATANRSGGSTARATREGSCNRSGSETVTRSRSDRSSFGSVLGLDVIIVDIGHLPAQRGKNLGGASGSGPGSEPEALGSQLASRGTLSVATHRAPDQLDQAPSTQFRQPRSGLFARDKPADERREVFALIVQSTFGNPSGPVTDARFQGCMLPAINISRAACHPI
jgi:hypothetical protein